MATFRTQNNVPDVYVKGSRDFQLFCNLFDCLNGSIKYDIDSIPDVVDTNQCNERLLPYLQTKLGFWTNVKIRSENLRTIMKGFLYAVKNKGSKKGVEQAVQIFLKIAKINTPVHIEIVNEPKNETQDPYTVIIGTEQYLGDTTILDEILRYILPAGYAYRYTYYSDQSHNNTTIKYGDSVRVITGNCNYSGDLVPGQALLGAIRTKYKYYTTTEENGQKIRTYGNFKTPDIINNVNLTTVSSDRVPLPGNSYTNAPQIRNPVVEEDPKEGIVIKKENITNLYNNVLGEDKNGN